MTYIKPEYTDPKKHLRHQPHNPNHRLLEMKTEHTHQTETTEKSDPSCSTADVIMHQQVPWSPLALSEQGQQYIQKT